MQLPHHSMDRQALYLVSNEVLSYQPQNVTDQLHDQKYLAAGRLDCWMTGRSGKQK